MFVFGGSRGFLMPLLLGLGLMLVVSMLFSRSGNGSFFLCCLPLGALPFMGMGMRNYEGRKRKNEEYYGDEYGGKPKRDDDYRTIETPEGEQLDVVDPPRDDDSII